MMEQPISRRTILTLAGSGLAGATAVMGGGAPAAAEQGDGIRVAVERAYHPLAQFQPRAARIQHVDVNPDSLVRVEVALERRAIFENRELVIGVHVSVPDDRVGRRRVLRATMIGDNGDLRMETVGPEIRIDHPVFELEIALGRGDPIRDWNLIHERIFAARVSLTILDTDDFAVSDDYLFKVRRS